LLDFFLWGFIKDRVMSIAPIAYITENVKNRIRRACAEVTLEMLVSIREIFCQKILKEYFNRESSF